MVLIKAFHRHPPYPFTFKTSSNMSTHLKLFPFLALLLTVNGAEEAAKQKRSLIHDFSDITYYPSFYSNPNSFDITLPLPPVPESIHQQSPLDPNIRPVMEETDQTPPPLAVPTVNTSPLALGSGSLGVVQIGQAGYVLGSGSIGYSPPRGFVPPQQQPQPPQPPQPPQAPQPPQPPQQPSQQPQQQQQQVASPQQQQPQMQPQQAPLQQPPVASQDDDPFGFLSQSFVALDYFPVSSGNDVPIFLREYLPVGQGGSAGKAAPLRDFPQGYSTTVGLSGFS